MTIIQSNYWDFLIVNGMTISIFARLSYPLTLKKNKDN